jgi:hypothetical protein
VDRAERHRLVGFAAMSTSRPTSPDPRGAPTASGAQRGTGRRVSPGVVILAIALIGSILYTVFVLTVRDASQIPLLVSGLVILAIVFIALAAYCARGIWRASIDGRDGRAFALAVGGGLAAIAGAGCVAGAIILILLRQTAG